MNNGISPYKHTDKYVKTGKWETLIFCGYIFFCFFEPYTNIIIGSVGKYLILVVVAFFLYSYSKVKFEWYHASVILWLALKILSIFWASMNYIVRLHFFPLIGMLALFITMTVVVFDDKFIKAVLDTSLYASLSVGLLSIFFSAPYQSELFNVRQVLTLFGAQNDPNDQAAFLLVGIAIALYRILNCKNNKRIFYFCMAGIILINTYAIFKTGSRAGLLTIAFIGLCAIFLSDGDAKKLSLKSILNVIIVFISGIALYFFAMKFLPSNTFERMFSFSSYQGGSGRTEIWENALQIFWNHPFLGGGWGSYWGYNDYFNAVHNTLISTLTDGGIIGFLLLYIPILFIGLITLKRKCLLPLMIFICGFAPSLFLDAINKRFFWNALIIALIMVKNNYTNDKNRLNSSH